MPGPACRGANASRPWAACWTTRIRPAVSALRLGRRRPLATARRRARHHPRRVRFPERVVLVRNRALLRVLPPHLLHGNHHGHAMEDRRASHGGPGHVRRFHALEPTAADAFRAGPGGPPVHHANASLFPRRTSILPPPRARAGPPGHLRRRGQADQGQSPVLQGRVRRGAADLAQRPPSSRPFARR